MIARSCWCIHSYVFTYLSEFVCLLAEVCMCCSDSGLEHQRFPSLNQCGLGRTATAYLISFTAQVCQRLLPLKRELTHTHMHARTHTHIHTHTHTLKSHLLWMMGEGSHFKGTPLPPSSLALKVTPQHLCLLIISSPLTSGGQHREHGSMRGAIFVYNGAFPLHGTARYGTVRFTFGGFSTGYCTWYLILF